MHAQKISKIYSYLLLKLSEPVNLKFVMVFVVPSVDILKTGGSQPSKPKRVVCSVKTYLYNLYICYNINK